jgi:hypothetical protein
MSLSHEYLGDHVVSHVGFLVGLGSTCLQLTVILNDLFELHSLFNSFTGFIFLVLSNLLLQELSLANGLLFLAQHSVFLLVGSLLDLLLDLVSFLQVLSLSLNATSFFFLSTLVIQRNVLAESCLFSSFLGQGNFTLHFDLSLELNFHVFTLLSNFSFTFLMLTIVGGQVLHDNFIPLVLGHA